MSEKLKIQAGSDRHYYWDVCLLGLPLVSMAFFYYGARPVWMCLYATVLGNLCDRLVCFLRKRPYERSDWSSECFSLIIALLMPASCPWPILTVAVLAGILIGKEAFGGYGSYPFNPAAVGYVVVAVSWPEQVMRYPAPDTMVPFVVNGELILSGGMSNMLRNGGIPTTDMLHMLLGNYAGPMGTTAILVLIACGIFLLVRRDIKLYTPLAFLLTCGAVAFLHPRDAIVENAVIAQTTTGRVILATYELVSGAILFGALFLATEPFTTPQRHRGGQVLYGVLLGLLTMAFRYFGVYDTGICFATLVVGSVSQWLDRLTEKIYEVVAMIQQKGGPANAK